MNGKWIEGVCFVNIFWFFCEFFGALETFPHELIFQRETLPHEPKNGTIRGAFPHELKIHFPLELNLRQRAASANPSPITKPTATQSIQNATDRPTSWFSHVKPPQTSTNTKSRHPHPLLSFFLSLSLSILLFLLLFIINNPFVLFCPVLSHFTLIAAGRPCSSFVGTFVHPRATVAAFFGLLQRQLLRLLQLPLLYSTSITNYYNTNTLLFFSIIIINQLSKNFKFLLEIK